MDLFALPFPIAIVAPDGWASFNATPDDVRMWNRLGVRKYNRIGFIVADSHGSVWRLLRIEPEAPATFLHRIVDILVPQPRPVHATVESMDGDPLTVFREHFAKALEKDDDCLQQFHSKEKIQGVLASADSVVKLFTRLHKMRVIR